MNSKRYCCHARWKRDRWMSFRGSDMAPVGFSRQADLPAEPNNYCRHSSPARSTMYLIRVLPIRR